MSANYAYLVMVDGSKNNNKFYEIKENNDGSLDTRYGRIGKREMFKHYEPYEKSFYGLMQEKLNKGYEDKTALHTEMSVQETSKAQEKAYKPVENENVQFFLDKIIDASREFMTKNYTIKESEITEKMVNEAQADLNELNEIASNPKLQNSLYFFNQKLQELFSDVPRKMERVSEYLANTEADFGQIIDRETQMLDNIKANMVKTIEPIQGKDQTVLEAYGLTARPVTFKEEDQILAHLGKDYDGRPVENRFIQAFAVENSKTRTNYEAYKADKGISNRNVKLFYHGTKTENVYSIMKQGLSLNPNASITAKMFGQGLYFAPECRKSLNYMDTRGSHWNSGQRETGYCLIFAVALGKSYEPNHILGSNFTEKDLPRGTDSVFASKHNSSLGLRNDEYIVFNENACTVKYIMEMSSQFIRDKTYNLDRKALRDNLADGFNSLVKVPNGLRAELEVERLPQNVQKIISSQIADDYTHLYFDYNAKLDRISLSAELWSGESVTLHPDITQFDYGFLTRELKKAFVPDNEKWKEIVKSSEEYVVGKTVFDKNEKSPEPITKENKATIEKE